MEIEEVVYIMSKRAVVNVECHECGSFVMKGVVDDEDMPVVYCEDCYKTMESKVEDKEKLLSEIKGIVSEED